MSNCIFDSHENQICGFVPRVLSCVTVCGAADGSKEECIKLCCDFSDGESTASFSVPKSKLDTFDWSSVDPRCCFSSDVAKTKAQRAIANKVRSQLGNATPTIIRYRFEQAGFYIVEGRPCFCTGKELIYAPKDTKFFKEHEVIPNGKTLDVDLSLSETEAIKQFLGLLTLCPNVGRVLISQMIAYTLRPMFVRAGITPKFCIYVHGKTGMFKTTYSTFLSQLYNRASAIESPVRLDASTAAAASILSEAKNEVVIFDDLCPSDSPQKRRQQEETFIELLRYIGDGTIPAKMHGKNIRRCVPECGVLMTGEYIYGTGSDAARVLPVEMTPIDGTELKYFQDNPLIASTFWKYFTEWLITRYDELFAELKDIFKFHRGLNGRFHTRLNETIAVLDSAYFLLMKYCHEKGIFTETQTDAICESFTRLLVSLAEEQNDRVNQGKANTVSTNSNDYLSHICEQYNNGVINYAESTLLYRHGYHDAVIYNNCLCLRGEWLNKAFPRVKLVDISKELDKQNAIVYGSPKSPAKQISELNGKRFYFIPLSCLQ